MSDEESDEDLTDSHLLPIRLPLVDSQGNNSYNFID